MRRAAFLVTSAITLFMAVAAPSLFPSPATAADAFPFDQELLLDTRPMPGSKRVPTLEVMENGSAVLDLWCASVKSQLVLAGDTVTILTGPKTPRACSPQAEQSDAALLASLEQVTTWRTVSDGVELRGPQTLRFLLSTH
jgi:hypothetical protein